MGDKSCIASISKGMLPYVGIQYTRYIEKTIRYMVRHNAENVLMCQRNNVCFKRVYTN